MFSGHLVVIELKFDGGTTVPPFAVRMWPFCRLFEVVFSLHP